MGHPERGSNATAGDGTHPPLPDFSCGNGGAKPRIQPDFKLPGAKRRCTHLPAASASSARLAVFDDRWVLSDVVADRDSRDRITADWLAVPGRGVNRGAHFDTKR